MGTYASTLEKMTEKATQEGLKLSIAGVYEVFVDIDKSLDYRPIVLRINQINDLMLPVEKAYIRHSKSGKGLHVRVLMREAIGDQLRVILTLLLRSDPFREILRMRAILRATDDVPSIFLDNPNHTERELWPNNEWSVATGGGVV